jgi:hypothetical protein
MRLVLFVRAPRAYKKIILNHYRGEWILHDVDHIPHCFGRVYNFEAKNNVKATYAFRPRFADFLRDRKVRLAPEQLCLHFDGDVENTERFCSSLRPMWINGHDRFNKDVETLTKVAKEYDLKLLKPVVFSDYSWKGDLVEGFLQHRMEDGLFNFHLDYFWPLFRFI